MAERPAAEFGPFHHLVLNATAYLVARHHWPDPNAAMVCAALARGLTQASRETPRTQALCAAASGLLAEAPPSLGWEAARLRAAAVLADLFFWRLALAAEALTPEPEEAPR